MLVFILLSCSNKKIKKKCFVFLSMASVFVLSEPMDTTSHGDTPGSHDCCALPPPAGGRDQHQCRGNTLFYSYTCCTACYCRGQTNISVEVTPCFTVHMLYYLLLQGTETNISVEVAPCFTPVVLPVTAGDRRRIPAPVAKFRMGYIGSF